MGFYARLTKNSDGSMNLKKWECGVPGKPDTPWENGLYKLTINFSDAYPSRPPQCSFTKPLFHPNAYPSGKICLSILNGPEDNGTWKPAITITQILQGVQNWLDEPNIKDAAQFPAWELYEKDPAKYAERVRAEAKKWPTS